MVVENHGLQYKNCTRIFLKHFFILFIFYASSIFSQTTFIQFSKLSTPQHPDTLKVGLYLPLIALNNSSEISSRIINFIQKADTVTTTIEYAVASPSIALVADGFMHETYLYPNDTASIFITRLEPQKKFLRDSLLAPWLFKFNYSGKHNKEAMFFDSLAYIAGALHNDFVYFNPRKETVDGFFEKEKNKYEKRIEYLKAYNLRNKLSKEFYVIANSEIKAAFFFKIFSTSEVYRSAFLQTNYFKNELLSFLSEVGQENENLYKNTICYSLFFRNKKLDSLSQLYNVTEVDRFIYRVFHTYESIKNQYIKDYELTYLMQFSKLQDSTYIKQLLKAYRSLCKTPSYISLIDSIYTHKVIKAPITEPEMLNSPIINTANKSLHFKDVFNKKPIVIDCWASWCKPCLNELPFSKQIEKNYKNKVDLIYLSFDRSPTAWIEKATRLGLLVNSYLLNKNFKSNWASYFNIIAIPRFLIFDKTGRLVTDNAPRPSDIAELKKILDQLVSEAGN